MLVEQHNKILRIIRNGVQFQYNWQCGHDKVHILSQEDASHVEGNAKIYAEFMNAVLHIMYYYLHITYCITL